MLIGRYLQWVETAPVRARIDAARTLVEVYGAPEIGRAARTDAELALFALLDDPAASVRRALAEAVAHAADVPRPLVVALAQDQSSVAAPVLRHSPLLSDADLVDAAAIGDRMSQTAIARRTTVRAPLAAALAEVAGVEALVALCQNPAADLTRSTMGRMLDRFADDGALREAMLSRDDLDPAVRHDLVVATATALTAFVAACDWLSPERAERVARESRDRATVTIAIRLRHDDSAAIGPLAAHLRAAGHLTPALILRALLSGNTEFFEAALTELSGLPGVRVAGHVRDFAGLGFASLYAKARMPPLLLPVFRAALSGLRSSHQETPPGGLHRSVIARVLGACSADDPSLEKAAALLRRFDAEAVRDEARALTASAWADGDGDAMPALMPWIIGTTEAAPRLTFQPAA